MPRSASGPASATAGRPLGGHGGSGKRWAMKASCRGVRTSLTRTGDMGGLLGMGKLRLFSVRWIYETGSGIHGEAVSRAAACGSDSRVQRRCGSGVGRRCSPEEVRSDGAGEGAPVQEVLVVAEANAVA